MNWLSRLSRITQAAPGTVIATSAAITSGEAGSSSRPISPKSV